MAAKIDKKDALKIGFGVGAVAVMYLIFSPGPSEGTDQDLPENTQASIIVPLPEDPDDKDLREKNKTELYEENYKQRNQTEEVVSDDAFFSTEYPEVDTSDQNQEDLEEFLSVTTEEKEPEQTTKNTLVPKSEPKKVYKEQNKEVEEQPYQPTQQKSRRRVGFTSNDPTAANNNSTVAADQDNTSTVTLPVVVQRDQTVKSGADILLRTTEEITLNGVRVAKNTYVNGKVKSISDNRMIIDVPNLKGVAMTVYDLYHTKGIAIEGGTTKEIKNDALGDVVDNATRTVEIPILKDLNVNRAANKKLNDPEIKIEKGHKLLLKPLN